MRTNLRHFPKMCQIKRFVSFSQNHIDRIIPLFDIDIWRRARRTYWSVIDFDPSYQKLTLHTLSVTRDGKSINRLTKTAFNLYRVETDADRLIYNGTVTASVVLKDIRVGDIIEYAYTVSGKNAYLKGSIGSFQRLQYGIPIDRFFVRLAVPNDRTYQTRLYLNAPKPSISTAGKQKVFQWAFDQRQKLDVDEDSPSWFLDYPYFQLTDKANWAEVGRWKSSLYAPPRKISSELKAAIAKIEEDAPWPEGKIDAVLKFVQGDIRYLGIEIGAGGYIPRDPSEVLARRFGDCKDKTRLMVTMLNRMGIKANVLLVNTNEHEGIDKFLPSITAFDHVIAHVKYNGKSYFLDPTKGVQLGNVNSFQQSTFGKGVDLHAKSTGMIDVQPKLHAQYAQDIIETFGFGKTTKTVTLFVETKLYGDKADTFLRWKSSDGEAAIAKNYLEHYQKTYPTIKEMEPLKYEIDKKLALVTITEHYMIPEAWQQVDDKKPGYDLEFSAEPTGLSAMPLLNKRPRNAPFAITHPVNVRHQLKFRLPENWAAHRDNVVLENMVFAFKNIAKKSGNNYSETYTYKTKKNYIAPDELQKVMRDIERSNNAWGVTFQSGDQYQSEKDRKANPLTSLELGAIIGVIAGFFILLFGVIGFIVWVSRAATHDT